MATATTSYGTKYLPLSAYTAKPDGSLVPPADNGGASGEDTKFLLALGLSESKAAETLQNTELTADLKSFVEKVGGLPLDKALANLVYDVASRYRASAGTAMHVDFLLDHLKKKTITSKAQLEAALAYLKKHMDDLSGFDAAAGIGVVVTPEAIAAVVATVLGQRKAEIDEARYRTNTGSLLGSVREQLPWADVAAVKTAIDKQLATMLGPRTAADDEPAKKKPAKPKAEGKSESKGTAAAAAAAEPAPEMTFSGAAANFHAPGHNDETDGYLITPNTKKILAEHLKRTGGQIRTRFPPEPNGILHVGHAKAMNFNFSFARERTGVCYLRYDDTNPEKEEKEFFDGIARDVAWLGHKPWKITYASDHFQQLYEWAIVLIKKGLAYVCHQKVEELRGFDHRAPSPYRDRPIEESLKLFEDMKNGLIDEGGATLRLKHEMEDGKLDPVAYRIKFFPHHRTGNKWCIYPTYDYTHCLCDSIEDITHSLCTKEFQNRRYSYYWLCNALDLYCPVQWEYSRLNMQYALVSKRKIAKLIEVGAVSGWDDPRLFTLSALRRKGYPPRAINDFCNKLGVTVASSVIGPEVLESCIRESLNLTSNRAMAVINPLRVVLLDFPADKTEMVSVPDMPLDQNSARHQVPLSSVVYIDRADFQAALSKGYKRLAPGQAVGLKHAGYVISVKKLVEENGNIAEIHVDWKPLTDENKPQAFIHWVSNPAGTAPLKAEIRIYNQLFVHPYPDDPVKVPGGFLTDINPDSLVIHHGLIDTYAAAAAVSTVLQFERVGYFCVDPDSRPGKPVFNCTVNLKEDVGKKKAEA